MKSILVINADKGTIDRLMPNGEVRQNIGHDNGVGYLRTTVNRVKFYVHRLIWEHVHGHIPEGMQIDHINGNTRDNRISNLRLVNGRENTENQHFARSDNATSGVKGVSKRGDCDRYRAQIRHGGKTEHLGNFKTVAEAQAAYAQAAAKFHTHNPHAAT